MAESTITKEQLIEFGMVETGGLVMPLKKVLGESEAGQISIAVTLERNTPEIILSLPDGAHVLLSVASIEQLKAFEACIVSWESNY